MENLLTNMARYFDAGGFVMPGLLLLSVGLWAMIAERWLYLFRPVRLFPGWRSGKANLEVKRYETAARDYLTRRDAEAARRLHAICRKARAEMAAFLHRALLENESGDAESLVLSVDEAFSVFSRRVRSRIGLISVLSSMAPMLGLLGTVSGMIEAFETMMLSGGADAKALSGGISAALITTQVGLVVALPGMFSRSLFARRAEALEEGMQLLGVRIKSMVAGSDAGATGD